MKGTGGTLGHFYSIELYEDPGSEPEHAHGCRWCPYADQVAPCPEQTRRSPCYPI